MSRKISSINVRVDGVDFSSRSIIPGESNIRLIENEVRTFSSNYDKFWMGFLTYHDKFYVIRAKVELRAGLRASMSEVHNRAITDKNLHTTTCWHLSKKNIIRELKVDGYNMLFHTGSIFAVCYEDDYPCFEFTVQSM